MQNTMYYVLLYAIPISAIFFRFLRLSKIATFKKFCRPEIWYKIDGMISVSSEFSINLFISSCIVCPLISTLHILGAFQLHVKFHVNMFLV